MSTWEPPDYMREGVFEATTAKKWTKITRNQAAEAFVDLATGEAFHAKDWRGPNRNNRLFIEERDWYLAQVGIDVDPAWTWAGPTWAAAIMGETPADPPVGDPHASAEDLEAALAAGREREAALVALVAEGNAEIAAVEALCGLTPDGGRPTPVPISLAHDGLGSVFVHSASCKEVRRRAFKNAPEHAKADVIDLKGIVLAAYPPADFPGEWRDRFDSSIDLHDCVPDLQMEWIDPPATVGPNDPAVVAALEADYGDLGVNANLSAGAEWTAAGEGGGEWVAPESLVEMPEGDALFAAGDLVHVVDGSEPEPFEVHAGIVMDVDWHRRGYWAFQVIFPQGETKVYRESEIEIVDNVDEIDTTGYPVYTVSGLIIKATRTLIPSGIYPGSQPELSDLVEIEDGYVRFSHIVRAESANDAVEKCRAYVAEWQGEDVVYQATWNVD